MTHVHGSKLLIMILQPGGMCLHMPRIELLIDI